MSGKNQYPFTLNWQSTNPQTSFLPQPQLYAGGSQPSGVTSGTMSSTNTIYTNILCLERIDNVGLEVSWTGTPTGTLTYICSNSGKNFFPITLTTTQPSGSAGGFGVNLNQLPYKYFMVQYTNASGSGVLSITGQSKDLN